MVFNSLTFILFFAVVLLLHNLPLSWQFKKFNLLVASYIFYAAWNPPFILLLWASTAVDWLVARKMHRETQSGRRKAWLVVSLVVNLGCLAFFKYGKFLLENWQALMSAIGVQYTPPEWNILLPVGISFYTFHSMSYTLDIYWRRVEPIPKLFDFALFVAFFTQLVAGPILRTSDLVPQFERPRTATRDQLCWGLALMTLGLFEKVVIADGAFAPAADMAFGSESPLGALDAWIGTLAFSGQIFCDFAGYSTIAVGAALCLGFNIPNNFNSPYGAIGFSDFWRRWHISLSTWLRDYLYIPLGGNRKGEGMTYRNLMMTMLLGGLWHGANWTFVVWGGLHGLFLAAERWIKQVTARWNLSTGLMFKLALTLVTFTLINVTWVFFRAKSLSSAMSILGSMVGLHGEAAPVLPTVKILETLICIGGLFYAHWYMRNRQLEEVVARAQRSLVLPAAWACMAFAVVITQGAGDAFIYFQF
ncbi:MAG TPA: MBOAT family O-acyltransferase [Lysobacter sp.]|nr:MBOAT family O-acyltransferase [Lysobacter sp.]